MYISYDHPPLGEIVALFCRSTSERESGKLTAPLIPCRQQIDYHVRRTDGHPSHELRFCQIAEGQMVSEAYPAELTAGQEKEVHKRLNRLRRSCGSGNASM